MLGRGGVVLFREAFGGGPVGPTPPGPGEDTDVAHWGIGATRFYAVDTAGGNDLNAGFSDISQADAFTVAKRTWAGLVAVIPRLANGQHIQIAIKKGTYTAQTLRLMGLDGYDKLHLVASTDGTDSVGDRILSGFQIASAGPETGSSWKVKSSPAPTVNTFTINAGTLPAEPSVVGKRIRFTTGAQVNVCACIQKNTGTVITLADDLPLAPVAGDLFVIEEPGTIFDAVVFSDIVVSSIALRGIKTPGAWLCENVSAPAMAVTGCEGEATTWRSVDALSQLGVYTGINLATTRVGVGYRSGDTQALTHVESVDGDRSGSAVGMVWTNVERSTWGRGTYCRDQFQLFDCGGPTQGSGFILGSQGAAGFQPHRQAVAHMVIVGVIGQLFGIKLDIATLSEIGVRFFGLGNRVGIRSLTGTCTASVVHCVSSSDSLISIDAATTATGAGDLSLGPTGASVSAAFSDLTRGSITDANANTVRRFDPTVAAVIQTYGQVNQRVTNKSGGTITPGTLVRKTATGIEVTTVQADTAAHATGGLLVMTTTTLNNADGYAIPLSLLPSVDFDAAPTIGALAYLSPGTAGKATTTVPAVNATDQRRRLGYVIEVSSSTAKITDESELLPVTADGTA